MSQSTAGIMQAILPTAPIEKPAYVLIDLIPAEGEVIGIVDIPRPLLICGDHYIYHSKCTVSVNIKGANTAEVLAIAALKAEAMLELFCGNHDSDPMTIPDHCLQAA